MNKKTVLMGAVASVMAFAQGGMVVNLNPDDALYTGTDTAAENAAGYAGCVDVRDMVADESRGFTFHITFTPDEVDMTGTVLLMEVGGTIRGFGLYLIDGIAVAVCKSRSPMSAFPRSKYDLDISRDRVVAVASPYGRLSAGREYTMVVSLHPRPRFLDFAVQGNTLRFERYFFYGDIDRMEWLGDGTLSVRTTSSGGPRGHGSQGGLSSTPGIWSEESVKSLSGDVRQALFWNHTGAIVRQ